MINVPYDALRKVHEDETVLVCGTGPSFHENLDFVKQWDTGPTIGINRACGYFNPTYTVLWDCYRSMPGKYKEDISAYTGHVISSDRHRTKTPPFNPINMQSEMDLKWAKHTFYVENNNRSGSDADWIGL